MPGITDDRSIVQLRRHGTSLSMYRHIPDLQGFWDDHWGDQPIATVLERARTGFLSELERPLLAHLPREGTILEAGCGTGRIVQALQARGYSVVGLDYASNTIAEIRAAAPELQVEEGDIGALRWEDETFAAYVSIGVLEHMFTGPDQAIAEAVRVLRPGGRALISVPYLNLLRRRAWRKASFEARPELGEGWRFYQDHVDADAFRATLEANGLRVIATEPYGLFGALMRDSKLLATADRRGWIPHRVRKRIKRSCAGAPRWFALRNSHMMMFVCERGG